VVSRAIRAYLRPTGLLSILTSDFRLLTAVFVFSERRELAGVRFYDHTEQKTVPVMREGRYAGIDAAELLRRLGDGNYCNPLLSTKRWRASPRDIWRAALNAPSASWDGCVPSVTEIEATLSARGYIDGPLEKYSCEAQVAIIAACVNNLNGRPVWDSAANVELVAQIERHLARAPPRRVPFVDIDLFTSKLGEERATGSEAVRGAVEVSDWPAWAAPFTERGIAAADVARVHRVATGEGRLVLDHPAFLAYVERPGLPRDVSSVEEGLGFWSMGRVGIMRNERLTFVGPDPGSWGTWLLRGAPMARLCYDSLFDWPSSRSETPPSSPLLSPPPTPAPPLTPAPSPPLTPAPSPPLSTSEAPPEVAAPLPPPVPSTSRVVAGGEAHAKFLGALRRAVAACFDYLCRGASRELGSRVLPLFDLAELLGRETLADDATPLRAWLDLHLSEIRAAAESPRDTPEREWWGYALACAARLAEELSAVRAPLAEGEFAASTV
jgi:hypothetical protein